MTAEAKAMEIKKAVPVTAPAKSWSIFEFVGNIKEEFSKVTWTNPDELRLYTKLVVGTTFVFGLGIYCIDLAIQSALHLLGSLFHVVFG